MANSGNLITEVQKKSHQQSVKKSQMFDSIGYNEQEKLN